MTQSKVVFLSAGGTGGHLFPAEALANALAERGFEPHLLTDARGLRYASRFPGPVHEIASETLRGKNPVAIARMVLAIGRGYVQTMALIRQHRPSVVAGFGGYPSLPPMLAALTAKKPTLLHEQNGVMGKANRLVARRVSRVAVSFPRPHLTPEGVEVVLTGNPVRPHVAEVAATPYPGGDRLNLLVFGGSQGARVLSDTVPEAVAGLGADVLSRLVITQQAQDADLERVKARYEALGVTAEVAPFFADLPARIASAHLVISRAGASTVAELTAIGRPSILVPLRQSIDGDQAANARSLEAAGGAVLLPEDQLRAGALPPLLQDLLPDAGKRAQMAARARGEGRIEAAATLADIVINLASKA